MRHRRQGKKLGRERGPRRALQAELARALIERGAIQTTLPKAKITRSFVERLVTIARQPTLHHRRLLLQAIQRPKLVEKLLTTYGPRYAQRPGGYLRIIALGHRVGDRAPLARVEFVH